MPWGLSQQEWEDLKNDQYEYNRRKSCILEKREVEDVLPQDTINTTQDDDLG